MPTGFITATMSGIGSSGRGMMVNSSRAILYAGSGEDFAHAAREAARQTRDALRGAVRNRPAVS